MAFLQIFVSHQLLFLFSKHLDIMSNVMNCGTGRTDLCLEVDDFVAELELELFLGWLKQMSGWTRPHKLNRLTWFQLIFLAIVLYMMDQRVNSLSSESREKERIKICNIIVFDQLSLCAQWVHLDKKKLYSYKVQNHVLFMEG